MTQTSAIFPASSSLSVISAPKFTRSDNTPPNRALSFCANSVGHCEISNCKSLSAGLNLRQFGHGCRGHSARSSFGSAGSHFRQSAPGDFGLQLEQSVQQRFRPRRATGDINTTDDVIHALDTA